MVLDVAWQTEVVRCVARLEVLLLMLLLEGLHLLLLRLSYEGNTQGSRWHFLSVGTERPVDGGGNVWTGNAVYVIIECRGGSGSVRSGYGVRRMHDTCVGIWLKLWLELMLVLVVVVGRDGGGAQCPGIRRSVVVKTSRDVTADAAGRGAGGSCRRVPRGSRRLGLVVHHERVLKVVRQRRLERALLERAAHGKHASGPGCGGCRCRGLGGHRGVRRVRRGHLSHAPDKVSNAMSRSPPRKQVWLLFALCSGWAACCCLARQDLCSRCRCCLDFVWSGAAAAAASADRLDVVHYLSEGKRKVI